MKPIGAMTWILPDMYWPEHTSPGKYVSHESVCVLNTSDTDCDIRFDLYFEDRDPLRGLRTTCKASRTHHVRMDTWSIRRERTYPGGFPTRRW